MSDGVCLVQNCWIVTAQVHIKAFSLDCPNIYFTFPRKGRKRPLWEDSLQRYAMQLTL